LRGDFGAETVFGDAVEQAQRFVAAGASYLHVVDLDAARSASTENREIIRSIVASVDVPVQVGGGVRDEASAIALLAFGVARVVIGTLAVEDPDGARQLAERHPGQVVVGLDHRPDPAHANRRIVAVRGWEESGGVELVEALHRVDEAPFAATVITDISRDGTLEGPDLVGYRWLLEVTGLPIIASGGISGGADLAALADIETNGRRLFGAVIGRALVSGAMSVEEAIASCAR
jgi:phosphoribosylformimino-5-aminoimidazole carboxamide ribotide isomerase